MYIIHYNLTKLCGFALRYMALNDDQNDQANIYILQSLLAMHNGQRKVDQ